MLIAKLTSGEMAYYDVWFDGFTKNPWNLLEGSSGSSAGGVAVVGWDAQPAASGAPCRCSAPHQVCLAAVGGPPCWQCADLAA